MFWGHWSRQFSKQNVCVLLILKTALEQKLFEKQYLLWIQLTAMCILATDHSLILQRHFSFHVYPLVSWHNILSANYLGLYSTINRINWITCFKCLSSCCLAMTSTWWPVLQAYSPIWLAITSVTKCWSAMWAALKPWWEQLCRLETERTSRSRL